MDSKAVIKDPRGKLEALGLSGEDPVALELLGQVEEIRKLRGELKRTKGDKAQVARQFKAVDPGTEAHAQLVERMQTVSSAIKSLESSMKPRERAIQEILAQLEESQSRTLSPPFFKITANHHYPHPFKVRELSPDAWSEWYRFVESQERAPLYYRAPWAELIEEVFGHATRVWCAYSEDGEILGGVPLTFFHSRLFGHFAVAVPYFNYGGVLTSYSNIAQQLMGALESVCRDERLSHIEVRTMQPGLGFNSQSRKVSMVLPLPRTTDALEDQLGSKVRAQVKKAERFEPTIRFGGASLLDDFYRVFAINMRDLGTPVYSKRWFHSILEHPDITATLVVVYVAGKPVSTGFLLGQNGMLEIPWASTIKKANAMDTNMWMYRQILDFAVREGYEFFDFGRSTKDAGTYRFKKQWGARPYEHHWYYILPKGGSVPGLNPDNPKYRLLIAVWKRLPVWVTKLIGPPVVKSIP